MRTVTSGRLPSRGLKGLSVATLIATLVVAGVLVSIASVAYTAHADDARAVGDEELLTSIIRHADLGRSSRQAVTFAYTDVANAMPEPFEMVTGEGSKSENPRQIAVLISPDGLYVYIIKNTGDTRCSAATWNGNGPILSTTINQTETGCRATLRGINPDKAHSLPPTAPTNLKAGAQTRQVTLVWDKPTDDGGATITGYQVAYSTDEGFTWEKVVETGSTLPLARLNELNPKAEYVFKTRALNEAGPSAWSNTTTPVTPVVAPGAPSGLTVTRDSAKPAEGLELSWTEPEQTNSNSVIGYRVWQVGEGGKTALLATTRSTSHRVENLQTGVDYSFAVTAYGASGVSAASGTASGTPDQAPGTPQNLVLVMDNAHLDATWQAPAEQTGSPIENYVVQYRPSGADRWSELTRTDSTSTQASFDQMRGGSSYEVRVAARNKAGVGPFTPIVAGSPLARPGEVPSITATGGKEIILNWKAPSEAVDGYRVWRKNTSQGVYEMAGQVGPETRTWTDSGAIAGVEYTYHVTGYTLNGQNGASSPIKAVWYNAPGSPADLKAQPGADQVTLTWMLAKPSESAPVEGYRLWRVDGETRTLVYQGAGLRYTDSDLTPGRAYTWTLVAYGAGGESIREVVGARTGEGGEHDLPATAWQVTNGPAIVQDDGSITADGGPATIAAVADWPTRDITLTANLTQEGSGGIGMWTHGTLTQDGRLESGWRMTIVDKGPGDHDTLALHVVGASRACPVPLSAVGLPPDLEPAVSTQRVGLHIDGQEATVTLGGIPYLHVTDLEAKVRDACPNMPLPTGSLYGIDTVGNPVVRVDGATVK